MKAAFVVCLGAGLVLVSAPAWACSADTDCNQSTQFCNTQTAACVARIANGQPIPTISGHNPPLNGTCTGSVGAAVCATSLCDSNNLCGWAAGHSGCDAATAGRCQSGICSVSGVCLDPGTCAVDGDCTTSQFCNTQTKACTAKESNGTAIPSFTGHSPPVTGQCNLQVAPVVCASNVCDTADNACGYGDGRGTCDGTSGPLVCRSGVCAPTGICQPASGCTADNMCVSTQYCNTASHACVDKVKNGDPIPTVSGHTPDIAGKCTPAVGASVCAAGFCDTDDKCGLNDTHGPCTSVNAAQVCRGGLCTTGNTCTSPASTVGCTADIQCVSTEFCDTATTKCVAKLANGEAIPTLDGHTPPLTGECNDATGKAVCVAGACDTADGKCGLADGHGPCGPNDGPVLCRSGVCGGTGGTCGTAPPAPPPPPQVGCTFEYECQAGQYCDNQAKACKPKLANDQPIPNLVGHVPVVAGKCGDEAAQIVCASGVCDTTDQRCGYRDGQGTCTEATGPTVCRSSVCEPPGVCGFKDDGALGGGGCSTTGDSEDGRWSLVGLGALLLAVLGRRRKQTP